MYELYCHGQELTEHKYKSEALIHELSSKLRSVEEVSVVCENLIKDNALSIDHLIYTPLSRIYSCIVTSAQRY